VKNFFLAMVQDVTEEKFSKHKKLSMEQCRYGGLGYEV